MSYSFDEDAVHSGPHGFVVVAKFNVDVRCIIDGYLVRTTEFPGKIYFVSKSFITDSQLSHWSDKDAGDLVAYMLLTSLGFTHESLIKINYEAFVIKHFDNMIGVVLAYTHCVSITTPMNSLIDYEVYCRKLTLSTLVNYVAATTALKLVGIVD